jgi:hypothetical protein
MTLVVENYRELMRALAKADRDVRLGVRRELRHVAQPVQLTIEQLALSEIRNMHKSPQWARMRIGVTRTSVYVAPKQRGARKNPYARRPNFKPLMMARALEPGLKRTQPLVLARFGAMLDELVARFNHTGG